VVSAALGRVEARSSAGCGPLVAPLDITRMAPAIVSMIARRGIIKAGALSPGRPLLTAGVWCVGLVHWSSKCKP